MSQRHATDVLSLVFGVLYGGFALAWALVASHAVQRHDIWWIGPAALVVAGGAGLAASLRPTRPTRPTPQTPSPDGAPDQ